MNQLVNILLEVAVLATVLATLALGCSLVAARRSPCSAARVTAGFLVALTVLPLFFLCPLPRWPACESPTDAGSGVLARVSELDPDGPPPEPVAAEAPSAGGVNVIAALAKLRQTIGRFRTPAANEAWNWSHWLALVLLAGAGLGVFRLLLGLAALNCWCRRSHRVDDAGLLTLLESLQEEMGGPVGVELLEADDLTAPATVGWRRPVILLPPDWRDWDEAERRAVLAHEWAHVCRHDYLAALVARAGVALHFYHPLVYWLAGRQHLYQELEADACGARWAGGRESYLRALARLALRQEGRPAPWPANAFLSGTGTLRRRIHMLRSRVALPESSTPRRGWALTVALLALTALGVAALRGPARAEDEPQTKTPDSGTVVRELPPFDLTYLPADALGVVALRPAVILGRPELRPALDLINLSFFQALQSSGLPRRPDLRLEEIEQVICCPRIESLKDRKKGGPQSALLLAPTMIRTTRPFDWGGQMKKMAPQVQEAHYAGKTYYKLPTGPAYLHNQKPYTAFGCYSPDARTLVFESEDNLRRFIDGKTAAGRYPWAEDWKSLERRVAAVAFDLRDKRWLADRDPPEEGLEETELLILQNAAYLAFGLDVADKIRLEALVRCVGAEAGKKVGGAVEQLTAEARAEVRESLKKIKKDEAKDFVWTFVHFQRDVLQNAKVDRTETRVHWHSEARLDLDTLARQLLGSANILWDAEKKVKANSEK